MSLTFLVRSVHMIVDFRIETLRLKFVLRKMNWANSCGFRNVFVIIMLGKAFVAEFSFETVHDFSIYNIHYYKGPSIFYKRSSTPVPITWRFYTSRVCFAASHWRIRITWRLHTHSDWPSASRDDCTRFLIRYSHHVIVQAFWLATSFAWLYTRFDWLSASRLLIGYSHHVTTTRILIG